MKESKPYIQKAYEKFAMMTKIQLETILQEADRREKVIDGQVAVMKASGKICLVIIKGNGSIIPFATIMSEDEADELIPDFDSLEPMTKLFYKCLKNDTRDRLEDFDEMLEMKEFSDKNLKAVGITQ